MEEGKNKLIEENTKILKDIEEIVKEMKEAMEKRWNKDQLYFSNLR